MGVVTHYDLFVVAIVAVALQITMLVALGIAFGRALARLRKETVECQRLTRMVAGLVAQETAKLRAAVRERT